MDEVSYLADWLERFLKNKDVFTKKIVSTKIEGNRLLVEEKTRTVTYHILGFSDDLTKTISTANSADHLGIALYNDKKNFKALITSWKMLSQFPHLVVYFINPFSKMDKRWVIFPHTHHRIADPDSLELGLRTMFETVEPVTREEVIKIVK